MANLEVKKLDPGWDYKASVEKVKTLAVNWKKLTLEMLSELYTAREELGAQGTRTDLTSGHLSRSWTQYCEDTGLHRRSVNRWLKRYDHADRKLIEVWIGDDFRALSQEFQECWPELRDTDPLEYPDWFLELLDRLSEASWNYLLKEIKKGRGMKETNCLMTGVLESQIESLERYLEIVKKADPVPWDGAVHDAAARLQNVAAELKLRMERSTGKSIKLKEAHNG